MNLTLLLALAISVPLLLVVALLSLVRGLRWFAAHPKGVASLDAVLALVHLASGAWESRSGDGTAAVVQVLVGMMWAAMGAYHWFRVKPQEIA